MTKIPQISGFVQAGGGSKRFGSDKALSVLSGKTMLGRTVELVGSVCRNVRIVAADGKYEHASAEILADRWPGEGPLGGILTALSEVSENTKQSAWSLMIGCDMPFLTREWLLYLCERATRSQAEVVFAESQIRMGAAVRMLEQQRLPELQNAFDSGVRKVTEAMKRIRREVLDETQWKRFDTEGRLFWNMNTPKILRKRKG